jgi:hypothetical protein
MLWIMRPSAQRTGEVVLALPGPPETLGVATHIRTTLLVSSLQSLRKRGSFDDYMRLLPQEHHMTITSMIAGQWLPIEIGLAHYQACQGLGISKPEAVAIGREVGDKIHGTFLATMVRMAGTAGGTPWIAMSFVGRLYGRLFQGGGGVTVVKVGPKDARVTFVGYPVARIPYYRQAMSGVFEAGMDLFCAKAYVNDVASECTDTTAVLDLAWA